MSLLCVRSNAGNDVRCDICGQGFVVHWSRVSPAYRADARRRVIQALRRHHADEHSGHHAHEEARFTVPSAHAEATTASGDNAYTVSEQLAPAES